MKGIKFLGSHIMLRKEYASMVISNKKKSTIRLGYIVPKKKIVIIHSGGAPIAKAYIEEVIHKRLKDLSIEDAQKEGYNSLEELIRELKRIYGKRLRNDSIITIIRFRVLERLDSLDIEKPYLGLKPSDIARISLKYLAEELNEEDKKILNLLIDLGSIRAVALKLYGDIGKRYLVRRVLKKSIRMLLEKGIIGRQGFSKSRLEGKKEG
ncbi:MAG: ASCH domain-containing protein [Sulfolobales archaeon]